MGIFIYKLNNDKKAEIQKSTELQTQVDSLKGSLSDLQEKISIISDTINGSTTSEESTAKSNQDGKDTTQDTSSNKKWSGDLTTINMSNLKKDGVRYEGLSELGFTPNYVRFKNLRCGSSVEFGLPKATRWVRLPSSAPKKSALVHS